MKRKLIQQMRNEWRSNLWMGVELVIVGLVLWAIFLVFGMLGLIHQEPQGYDLTDVYNGDLWTIDENATTHVEYPDSAHNEWTDMETLIANLRNNPNVEMAGAGNNALPYSYNYSGNRLAAHINGWKQFYMGNCRNMSPDFVRTIRLTGINGETTEELAQMIADGKTLISLLETPSEECNPEEWRGKEVFWDWDSTRTVHIGAIIQGIRRSDYEPLFRGVIINNNTWFPDQIAIRVKPGKGREFMESLKSEDLEFGNVYISNLQSIEQRRDAAHLTISTTIRNLTAGALFVMVAVFLGFLGSFWYKTQQRIPELALRRVNGATRGDLLRRLLGEGMLMLFFAAIPIAGLGALLLGQVNIEEEVGLGVPAWLPWTMFAAAVGALGLMIAGGIWFPAVKAMKINPAEALKDQ